MNKYLTPSNTLRLAIAAGLSFPTFALACASCGCTLDTDWESMGISGEPGFKFDLRYDYLNQDQLRSGTSTITPAAASQLSSNGNPQEVEKFTKTNSLVATLDYSNSPDWGINIQIPYLRRSHSTLGTTSDGFTAGSGGGQYDSNTSSVGDLKVIGRYQGLDQDHHAGLLFGFKLPTGSHTLTGTSTDVSAPGPVAIDRGLQPGTGTTDLILGAYYANTYGESWQYFAQGLYQTALNSKDDYKPGNLVNLNFGVRYSDFESFAPLLQLNIKHAAHDTGANADTVSTGGTLVYLTPGAVVPINARASVYGMLQLPVYQNVRGVQLSPRYVASVGVHLSF